MDSVFHCNCHFNGKQIPDTIAACLKIKQQLDSQLKEYANPQDVKGSDYLPNMIHQPTNRLHPMHCWCLKFNKFMFFLSVKSIEIPMCHNDHQRNIMNSHPGPFLTGDERREWMGMGIAGIIVHRHS